MTIRIAPSSATDLPAAAAVIMSRDKAEELGVRPLLKLLGIWTAAICTTALPA